MKEIRIQFCLVLLLILLLEEVWQWIGFFWGGGGGGGLTEKPHEFVVQLLA